MHRLGPFDVELHAVPGAPRSELVLPPLGRIEAATHLTPVRISATLRGVDPDLAAEVIREQGVTSLIEDIQREAPSALLLHVARGGLVAVVGTACLALLIHRRRLGAVAGTAGVGALVLLLTASATYATFRPEALAEARYTGALRTAREAVGPWAEAGPRLETFRDDLDRLVRATARAYGVLAAPPAEDAVAVLHISDIHASPLGMDFAQELAREFEADLVVDTGDLTTFSTPVETPIVERIEEFGIPYLFVRGNHDSAEVGQLVEAAPNGDTLESEAVTVEGIRFFGAPHPLFTGDADAEESDVVEAEVTFAGDALAERIDAEELPPDVVLVHDSRMALALAGGVPVVLSGHFHRFAAAFEDGTLHLRTGTTGAGGIDAFASDPAVPLSAQVIYFEGTPPRPRAVDRVTLDPITRDIDVRREVLTPEEAPIVAPSGSPTT